MGDTTAMSATLLEPRTSSPFGAPAPDDVIDATAAALRARGFEVRIAEDRAQARDLALELIPNGSEVNQASSKTIDELGIGDAIVERQEYVALKPTLWSMDRATQAKQIRQIGSAPEVMIGSAHAITADGQIVSASMSGSQLTAYAGGAGKVVYVVGSQKLVPNLATAFQRIEEYVFPLEDARAQVAYGVHSAINKLLIVRGDMPGRTSVVLVRDAIGF
jgi:LUD domain